MGSALKLVSGPQKGHALPFDGPRVEARLRDHVRAGDGRPERAGGSGRSDEASDAHLLARVVARDAEAFGALSNRYLPPLLRQATRVLRDETEAEDVAQEALFRLWQRAGSIETGPGGVAPWLTRVASNLCIDRLRARGRLEVTDDLPEVAVPGNQHRGLEAEELSGRVAEALSQLAERQRLALTLFHYEGMSMSEVGGLLGVSEEAVESLLSRARRTLKGLLANDWRALLPDPSDDP